LFIQTSFEKVSLDEQMIHLKQLTALKQKHLHRHHYHHCRHHPKKRGAIFCSWQTSDIHTENAGEKSKRNEERRN
jgi:hypothetical protein